MATLQTGGSITDSTLGLIPKCSLVFSGAGGELFTGALFHAYSPPPGFCFDSLCTDVLMDDPNIEDYNMDVKVVVLTLLNLSYISCASGD